MQLVELDMEDVLKIALKIATVLVEAKKNPAVLDIVPDSPDVILALMIALQAEKKATRSDAEATALQAAKDALKKAAAS